MKKSEIIIIATSAHRSNYLRDFLDCLANPAGQLVRFCFRKKWIEEKLLFDKRFLNKKCLIVFCDNPKKSSSEFDFYQVRFATFKGFELDEYNRTSEAKKEDVLIPVDFRLGEYVKATQLDITNNIAGWNAWMKKQSKKHPKPNDDKCNYVLLGELENQNDSTSDDWSWQAIVSLLSKSDNLSDCSFYRFVGIKKRKKYIQLSKFHNHDVFMLKSEKSYNLELQFYSKSGNENIFKNIAPSMKSESLSINPFFVNNIGQVTKVFSIISTKRVMATELAPVIIEDPKDNNLLPRIQMILGIRPLKRYMFYIVLMIIFGAMLVGVSRDMIKDVFSDTSIFYKNAGLFESIGKAIGSIFVGIGSFFGFKKVPG